MHLTTVMKPFSTILLHSSKIYYMVSYTLFANFRLIITFNQFNTLACKIRHEISLSRVDTLIELKMPVPRGLSKRTDLHIGESLLSSTSRDLPSHNIE